MYFCFAAISGAETSITMKSPYLVQATKTHEREREVSIFKQNANERGTPFIEIDPAVVDPLLGRATTVATQISPPSPFKSRADPDRRRAFRIDVRFHTDVARHIHIG